MCIVCHPVDSHQDFQSVEKSSGVTTSLYVDPKIVYINTAIINKPSHVQFSDNTKHVYLYSYKSKRPYTSGNCVRVSKLH